MGKFISRFGVRLNRIQWVIWTASMLCIVAANILGTTDLLSFAASIVGVTSLVFAAAGGLLGPLLMIVFSALYGIISWQTAYYGEMITYLGMTAPMSVLALVSWARHPAGTDSVQVKIADLHRRDIVILVSTTVLVTSIFYYILAALRTANLPMSTLSVTTSYAAAYLTWKRSPAYALAYAANDAVLIVLWSAALPTNSAYLSVVICFAVFLVNDVYGFISWQQMKRRQKAQSSMR